MKISLKDIATLQTGIYLKPEPFGDTLYLQVKDFDANGEIIIPLVPAIQSNYRLEKHLLQTGDILVIAKGNRNTAYMVSEFAARALASSTFLVLRLTPSQRHSILPAYLAWFINHPENQLFLGSHSKGSGISSLSLASMGELQVTVPAIEMQERILKIHRLAAREQKLLAQIARLRQQYHQQLLLNSLN
jgi:restriction endonuclease S subunit